MGFKDRAMQAAVWALIIAAFLPLAQAKKNPSVGTRPLYVPSIYTLI